MPSSVLRLFQQLARPVSLLKLVHEERKQEIQILLGDVVFWVDGKRYDFEDIRQSALTVAVASVSPSTYTFDKFASLLLPHQVGFSNAGGKGQHQFSVNYLRQKIFQINNIINAATNAPKTEKFLTSIRGAGYRLSPDWTVDTVPTLERTMEEDLSTLYNTIEQSITIVNNTEFAIDQHGTKTACIDENLIHQNNLIFNSNKNRIIEILRDRCTAQVVDDITNGFNLLHTFVTFGRSGANISDAAWRSAFANEVRDLYKRLRDSVISLHNVPELPKQLPPSRLMVSIRRPHRMKPPIGRL